MEYEDNWKPEVQFGSLLDLFCAHSIPNWHWPVLRGLSSPPSTNYTREPWPCNGTKAPLEANTGSKKSCHRNQIRDFGARHTVEYDSVLSQQSISGKIVSLILCVWKLSFFKSGHIPYSGLFTLVIYFCAFHEVYADREYFFLWMIHVHCN